MHYRLIFILGLLTSCSPGQKKVIPAAEGVKRDTVYTYYDADGNVEKRESWLDGMQFGDQYEYYPSGEIKSYAFHRSDGSQFYKEEYNESGKIVKQIGEVLLVQQKKMEVKVGEGFGVVIFPVTPPRCAYELEITKVDSTGAELFHRVSTPKDFLVRYDSKSYFLIEPGMEKGSFNYHVKATITDSVTGEIRKIATTKIHAHVTK